MTIDTIGSATTARPADRSAVSPDAAAASGVARAPATAVETVNAVKGSAPVPTLDQVSEAVSKLNKSPQAQSSGLEFSIDTDTKLTVVKVVDQSTKEVLRQMPTPEALAIAKALDEQIKSSPGLLLQQTA
ncbi:flagellar protein FlaG [Duganella callida]|uniref:Flagellar protein FlaG n=1 Tax=Duganella callida TaxID=2561932 RepID=A0A4Y9SPT6_9BURK|nr:flagellar protein FlaG [Duganella callida]TFW26016.1 flagellar protein FlaG [Duganella callida]